MANDEEVESTTEVDTREDIEMEPIKTVKYPASTDNEDSAELESRTSHASSEDESSSMNEECVVNAVMNSEVHEGKEANSSSLIPQQTRRHRTKTHYILKLLSRGSLYALGLAILVVGGVSSTFHPYVDPGEYENCTITGQSNEY